MSNRPEPDRPDEGDAVDKVFGRVSDIFGKMANIDPTRKPDETDKFFRAVRGRKIAEVRAVGSSDVPVVLAIPTTYMNLSGGPVQSAAAWFKIPDERIIVLHDELDVPPGALKLKRGGGHAGHNGLKDIDRALGTRDSVRIRIGVGRPPGRMPGKDYVLRRPSPADREQIDVVLEEAADAVAQIVAEGLEPAQNRYHSR